MSGIEQQLTASLSIVKLRQALERSNEALEQLNERYADLLLAHETEQQAHRMDVALLEAQLRVANGRLEKQRRIEVQTVGNVSFLLRPQAG
jgi:hypothetical protein